MKKTVSDLFLKWRVIPSAIAVLSFLYALFLLFQTDAVTHQISPGQWKIPAMDRALQLRFEGQWHTGKTGELFRFVNDTLTLTMTAGGGYLKLTAAGRKEAPAELDFAGFRRDETVPFTLEIGFGEIYIELAGTPGVIPQRSVIPVKGTVSTALPLTYRGFSHRESRLVMAFYLLAFACVCLFASAMGTLPEGSDVRRKRVRFIAVGVLLALAAALSLCQINRMTGKNFYPYNTFLFRPRGAWDDLVQTFAAVRCHFLPYLHGGSGNYFPTAYVFLYLIPTKEPYVAAMLLTALFLVVYFFSARHLSRLGSWRDGAFLAMILFLNYPFLFLMQSGNLEMLVFSLCALFVVLYRKYPLPAALLLAMAINLKLYPGVLGVLFLCDRNWRNAAYCALFSFLIFLFSAWMIDFNFTGMFRNLAAFQDIYCRYINDGLIFTHTFFSAYRYTGIHLFRLSGPGTLAALPYYTAMTGLAFAGIVWYSMRNVLTPWKLLFLLTVVMTAFPAVSFDYTLIAFLLPLALYLQQEAAEKRETLYCVLWVLLLSPLYGISSPILAELQLAVLLRPVILALFTFLIISEKEEKKPLF